MKTIQLSVLAAASILDMVDGEIPADHPFFIEAVREIRAELKKLEKGN